MAYLVQIDDKVRQATPEEITAIEKQQANAAAFAEQQATQQAAKESARAKLAALGLTDDEINALIR